MFSQNKTLPIENIKIISSKVLDGMELAYFNLKSTNNIWITYKVLISSTTWRTAQSASVCLHHHSCWLFSNSHFECRWVCPCKLANFAGTLLYREQNSLLDTASHKSEASGSHSKAPTGQHILRDRKIRETFYQSLRCLGHIESRPYRAEPVGGSSHLHVALKTKISYSPKCV